MISNFPRLRRQALDVLAPQRNRKRSIGFAVEFLESPDTRSFLVPEDGEIIDKNTPCSLALDSLHLPFPQIALEYSWSPEFAVRGGLTSPAATIILAAERAEGLYVNVVFGVSGSWLSWPVGVLFDDHTTIDMLDGIATVRDITLTTAGDGCVDDDSHLNELQPALVAMAHFALLCNCENVNAVRTFTPSAALVKRANERGNRPPDEYYILDCFLGEHQERGECARGSHSSPRFHVRRGHIRRLPDGRRTWVKQCTVGDASLGRIDKDYRVIRRQA
jgi:hypothetical protein